MADILIRGIPYNIGIDISEEYEVILRIQPNGDVLDAHKIHIGATALPLPEGHGGLYDRDALINELQNLFDKREKDARFSGNRGPSVTWNDAICHIIAAPIIIPAEGEGSDGNQRRIAFGGKDD